jgi:hypothetical protein
MSRGSWYFVAAVVGFLVLATGIWVTLKPSYPIVPTSEYQKAEDSKYSPGSPACYPSRLSGLPDREAADERYRCEQGAEEHRLKNDDLVQQTRSAEAAVALVGLTYNQSLMLLAGTIFGLLTLMAAFAAVLYAKRSADAAERAVRPHVFLGDIKLTLPLTTKSKLIIQAKNHGASAAVNVQIAMGSALVCRPIKDQAKDLIPDGWDDVPAFAPQFQTNIKIPLDDILEEDLAVIKDGSAAFVTRFCIRYEDLGGRKDTHETWFYIDRETLEDGDVMTLTNWARHHSYKEPKEREQKA